MALTNPTKLISVERLNEYHNKDKAERATEISNAVSAEATLRSNADTALQGNIDTINGKIPTEASTSNKLADKQYVIDSIAQLGGTFYGSFATKAALDAATASKKKNDYAVVRADETHSNKCTIYVWNGSAWSFMYVISDEPLTPEQLNALNSGITAAKVTSYDTHIADTANPHNTTLEKAANKSGITILTANKVIKVKSDGSGFELGDAGGTYTAGNGIIISGTSISVDYCANSDIDEIFV